MMPLVKRVLGYPKVEVVDEGAGEGGRGGRGRGAGGAGLDVVEEGMKLCKS